jgi:16S rRNA (guanine966-N2)-methyltransferase
LPVVAQAGLRPTAERIRETLFNWLAPVIEGSRCLDLFAGTGALGLESLSRGARSVVFVEAAAAAVTQLRESIRLLDAAGATVIRQDASDYLRHARPEAFDIVFVDPPFAADFYEELCRLLTERGWVRAGTLVYLEQDRRRELPALPPGWRPQREKTAGNVRYTLVRVSEEE